MFGGLVLYRPPEKAASLALWWPMTNRLGSANLCGMGVSPFNYLLLSWMDHPQRGVLAPAWAEAYRVHPITIEVESQTMARCRSARLTSIALPLIAFVLIETLVI